MEQDYIEKKVSDIIKRQIELENNADVFRLEDALKMAQKAEAKANKMGIPIVFSAVDKGGNLILLHKMEGSFLGSIDISINKAYTANAFQTPTHKLAESCLPGKPLYGLQNTNNGRVVIFGGGYPYYLRGNIAGGIGVSGGTVEEDMKIAEFSLV